MMRQLKSNVEVPLMKISCIAILAVFVLVGCKKADETHAFTPSPSSVFQTSTAEILTAEFVSPTQTPIPPPDVDNGAAEQGLIIFSMSDGEFTHLFAYNPSYLPITRLTSGNWNDNSPSISPDGNWLVFTSDRNGAWDIFVWNLVSNQINQFTNTPEFEGNPSWSPDNEWIVYEAYSGGQMNIFIQSATDPTSVPIQITNGVGNNYEPAWSPGSGRQIVFSTNRSGLSEIYIFQNDTSEFTRVAGGEEANYLHPSWSPDGSALAWERAGNDSTVEIWNLSDPVGSQKSLGNGKSPIWSPDGTILLSRIDQPNEYAFIGYSTKDSRLILPRIPVSGFISNFDWESSNLAKNIKSIVAFEQNLAPSPLCQPVISLAPNAAGRNGLISIESVIAPEPLLSDTTDECFIALRDMIGKKSGWDFLAELNNASLTLTALPDPGIPNNWLYTGRAIAVNTAPLTADWMVVSKEDFEGKMYWRLWLKCYEQDGSCGEPLRDPVWDFISRASGDLNAFENGGSEVNPPAGYWIDFSEMALRFGWERIPSISNWRVYYPGILFNTYVFRQGLSWEQAMNELYPPEVIQSLKGAD
jgi:TolB protein